jgi:hypothetical protein
MLQDAPEQFYHGKHKTRKTLLDPLRIRIDSVRQGTRKRRQLGHRFVEIRRRLGG